MNKKMILAAVVSASAMLMAGCANMGTMPSMPGMGAMGSRAAPATTVPAGFEAAGTIGAAEAQASAAVAAASAPTPVAAGAPVVSTNSAARIAPSGASIVRAPLRAGSPEAGDGLGPLDMVSVEVFGIPDLSRSVEVDGSGVIALPLIGRVEVEGLTPDQAARSIERLYRGRYVVNPSVSVRVTQRQARVISVTGAVVRPGVYQISGATSLLQGLALGGGFAPTGTSDVVQVLRSNGNRDQIISYNIADIERGAELDPWLVSGDRIIVTSAPRQVTVAGFVKEPGVYPFSGAITLTQALALGGGQLANADLRSINVLRTVEGRDFTTNYDIEAILAGRAVDPPVAAGDRVLVGALNQAVTIDGAVGQPTSMEWTRGLSLSRAVAEARGLGPTADKRNVAILRVINGQLQAATFDMEAINRGISPDPLLEPNDRVVVGEQRILTLIRDYAPLANIAYLIGIATQ